MVPWTPHWCIHLLPHICLPFIYLGAVGKHHGCDCPPRRGVQEDKLLFIYNIILTALTDSAVLKSVLHLMKHVIISKALMLKLIN